MQPSSRKPKQRAWRRQRQPLLWSKLSLAQTPASRAGSASRCSEDAPLPDAVSNASSLCKHLLDSMHLHDVFVYCMAADRSYAWQAISTAAGLHLDQASNTVVISCRSLRKLASLLQRLSRR